MKEKPCFCGHDKTEHYKTVLKVIRQVDDCKLCPCTEYMNRSSPTKLDHILFWIAVPVVSLMIIGFGFFIYGLFGLVDIVGLEKKIEITYSLLAQLVIITLALICVLLLYVIWPIIYDYRKSVTRKKF